MKKLLTLIALLACFMGAKAEWVTDKSVDYSTYSNFPFYPMGFVPEWVDGVMTDYGADYRYATQSDLDGDGDAKLKDGESIVGSVMAGTTEYQKVTGAGPYWHQYIIASDVPMELDETYTVKAVVRSTAAVSANLQFGNWGSLVETGVNIPASSDFQEVEWEVAGCTYAGNGFICIQPGTSTATIEWKSLTVSHNKKEKRPVTWQEWLNSDGQPFILTEGLTPASNDKYMGDAETPWGDLANVAFNDQSQNYLVCAWSKEKGRNMNEDGGWDPFPADIEVVDGSHVFVCHGQPATTEGDASAWDNQFWIQSPKSWKAGEKVKIHFRYKASQEVTSTDTQIHKQNPSDYLIWHAIGNIHFTEEWQEFDGELTFQEDMASGWSIAFNLNSVVKDAVTFYFDDLSWQSMKLDEGYFVAGANPNEGLEYNYDNAVEFTADAERTDEIGSDCVSAVIGSSNEYVSQIMISTVRGDDTSFKGNTLKPDLTTPIDGSDPDDWHDFEAASLAKINLPGEGIWKVTIAVDYNMMNFQMLEGQAIVYDDIVTNPEEIVVNGVERDDLSDQYNQQTGETTIREEEGGTGEAWDNQFWIVSNEPLEKGTETVLKFKYKASKAAKTTTQCHKDPGSYMHWAAIGDVNFTEEWQDFEKDFTVPNEADGMKSIAFNMAEIKEACDYYIKDVQWYIKDAAANAEGKTPENLIDATGRKNFYIKVGAGSSPVQSGIETILDNSGKKGSTAIYNIAGQRVTKDYKGIVIKDGKKYISR